MSKMKISVREILTDKLTDLPDHVQIEIGDDLKRVTISVRDGVISVSADGRLAVHPRAANLIYVESTS